MRKISIVLIAMSFLVLKGNAQEDQNNDNKENSTLKTILNNLRVNLESNAQWYTNDKELGDFKDSNFPFEDEPLRANSYLNVNYDFLKNFTAGIQLESYEPLPLLNYYPEYKGTNISNYFINYSTKKLNVTIGHFYEQFGSGLLLRAFEERQLGLNNALRGAKIAYQPTDYINIKALYGQPRYAFKTSDSKVYGIDSEVIATDLFNIENKSLPKITVGFSFVGKNENVESETSIDPISQETTTETPNYPKIINSFAYRLGLDFDNFYMNSEYNLKGADVSFTPANSGAPKPIEGETFDGNALLVNLGYSKKGIGVSGTFRRMENMSFYSERDYGAAASNQFNILSMNYLPALTKQQDYSLANIYIYQAQPSLQIQNFAGQAGEIGGQFDVFYNFKKGSSLGGKYGTKFTINTSYWALLDATFNQEDGKYKAEFLKFGNRLNRDINFEIRKKWSKSWKSIFTYINTIIDKGVTLGGPIGVQGDIHSDIVIAEGTYKFNKKSIRFEAQHLWTKKDKKNWVGGTLEFNATRSLSFYATDMYNYGNDIEEDQIHYYNFGSSYSKGASRIAINYGRQRGGLLCVGGVCRIVPENTGVTLNLTTSF